MSLEQALQAHTAAVEKNTAALASLHAAIVQALTGKAAANTDASTGTQQTNAGAGTGVPANGGNNAAAGAGATGEQKRGPGRPSNAAKAAAAAATGQAAASGQSQANPNPGNATQSNGEAGATDAGNASSGEDDAALAALLGGGDEPEPKTYNMADLQKMIKECAMFGQAYTKRALAEIKKYKTHNGLDVDQLPKLQAKDFNAFGAALEVIWNEGTNAAKAAKDPSLTL